MHSDICKYVCVCDPKSKQMLEQEGKYESGHLSSVRSELSFLTEK